VIVLFPTRFAVKRLRNLVGIFAATREAAIDCIRQELAAGVIRPRTH